MNGKCSVLVAALLAAGTHATVHAQISSKEQQAEQDAIDAKTPKLNFKEDVLQLLVPVGTFNRPTDVAWDSHDNVFVTDGYGNSRLVKIAPGGHWLKWVGTWGTGPNQFNIVHSVAVDANDNIYAADRNNHRIQVYDDDLNFIKSITGMGAPWGVCIPRADASGKQYIYSSDGTSGRIYKIDLTTGKVVGWAQTSLGRGEDDAGRLVHEIGCKDPNVVYLGSAILWNVTKVTITP